MNKRERESPSASSLVHKFVNIAKEEFAFLSDEYEFSNETIIEAYTKDGLKRVEIDAIDVLQAFFCIRLKFIKKNLELSFSYGDREFNIECIISNYLNNGQIERYSLWEWLDVLKIKDERQTSGTFVLDLDRLEYIVRDIAAVLKTCLTRIENANESDLNLLKEIRDRRIAEERHHVMIDRKNRTATQARQVFYKKEYKRVIELLSPFEADLSPSELKMLEYTKKHIDY